jgi:hypothetical protein
MKASGKYLLALSLIMENPQETKENEPEEISMMKINVARNHFEFIIH